MDPRMTDAQKKHARELHDALEPGIHARERDATDPHVHAHEHDAPETAAHARKHAAGPSHGDLKSLFLGLSSTQPTDKGENISEPRGGGYGRVPSTVTMWGPQSEKGTSNIEEVKFPLSTAPWLAGASLGFWILMTEPTGGVMRHWGTIAKPSKVEASNSSPHFAVGDLVIPVPKPE